MKESPRLPLLIRSEGEEGDFSPDQRMILQVIPLKFISAQEMSKILTPFLSADGTILAHDGSNVLLVVDKGINVLKCLKLVEVFDADVFDRVSHRFYFLENTRAEDLAKILKEVLSSYSVGKKDDVKLIPIERLNALLVISPQERALDEIESFLRQIDVQGEAAEPQIYVYFVKNGEAKQLGSILDSIFTKGGGKKKEEAPVKGKKPTNPLSMAAVKEKEEAAKPAETAPAATPAARGGGEEESGAVRGEVEITVDEVRNALVIKALPRDYQIVEKVLLRLDIMPRQVLIEAMIAEVTLTDETSLGIDWTFDGTTAVAPLGGLSATIGNSGLAYSVQLTNHWKSVLNAYANDNRLNVLSSPHILASDNKEAKIDVSDEIPVVTTTYTPTSTTTTDVYETSVQYRDTGIILTVTPHINDTGMVTLDVSQEVSEKSGTEKIGNVSYPTFSKKVVDTTLTLKHGQTLVMGGLIKERIQHDVGGLPCLVQVPILRFMAGKEYSKLNKTELILMITPRVVVNLEDVDAVTNEFKKKVKNVSLKFEEYKKTREFLKP
jgi:general secretion pathway protein D